MINNKLILNYIIERLSEIYQVPIDMIKGKKRNSEYVNIRHIIVYLAKTETDITFTEIAKTLNRDHSTAIHSFKFANDVIIKEPLHKQVIEMLQKEIRELGNKLLKNNAINLT